MTNSAKGTPRLFVFVVLCLVASIAGWSQNDVAVEPLVGANISEGGIIYKVTSQSPRTVEVTSAQSSYSGDIVIPSTMTWYSGGTWQYTVTGIGADAFRNCTSLTSVNIPSTVSKIGSEAFRYCSSLRSITIPSSVTSIGSQAFWGAGLKELTIAESSTPLSLSHYYVGNRYNGSPFYTCPIETLYIGREINHFDPKIDPLYPPFSRSLKEVVIGDQVTSIFRYSFSHCDSLSSVTFGRNIEEIGEYAFLGCTALQSANLGENVSTIGIRAFYGCTAMQSVNIPESVKTIQSEVFYNCESLQSVTGFAAVETIGESAFSCCSSLRSITIPSSVQEIGSQAFWGAGLKELTIAESSTPLSLSHYYVSNSYNVSPFYNCPIETLYIGREINNSNYSPNPSYPPFSTSLKEVVIGDQVASIIRYSFSHCNSLSSVTFGKNIEEIDASAFYGCTALQTLKAYWETPITTSDNTFSNSIYNTAQLYVPGGTKTAYQATSCWKKFQNILPMSFQVTATATAGGSVKVNGGDAVSNGTQSQWIDRETEVTFDVAEEEDYDLASVTLNGENVTEQLVDGRLTVASLEDDATLVATFAMLPHYTVTASVETLGNGVGGTVAVSNEVVISGRSCRVTITENEGYELKSVKVNCVDKTDEVTDGVLTLTNVTEDKSVTATFQKQRFAVVYAECQNGSIQLSTQEVEWDGTVTATILPAAHYTIDKVYVNGEDKTSMLDGNVLTLRNVRNAVNIEATFRLEIFAVTATATGGGSVMLSANEAEWGGSIVVTLTPEDEHEFVSLTVNGTDVTAQVENGQYTIQHVESATTVEALFKEITEATIVFSSTAPMVYCNKHNLDFSQVVGLKAYILPTCDGQALKGVSVANVPAGMGVVLKATQAGTYKVPYCENTSYSLNLLYGTLDETVLNPTEGESVNYQFSELDGTFRSLPSPCTLPAGTAWLQLPARVASGADVLTIVYEESGSSGDMNGDGQVNIADVTKLVNTVLGK